MVFYGDIYMMLHTVPRTIVLPFFYVSLVNLTIKVSWAIKNRITHPAFMLKIFQNVGHTMLTGQPQMLTLSRLLQEVRMSWFPAWGVSS